MLLPGQYATFNVVSTISVAFNPVDGDSPTCHRISITNNRGRAFELWFDAGASQTNIVVPDHSTIRAIQCEGSIQRRRRFRSGVVEPSGICGVEVEHDLRVAARARMLHVDDGAQEPMRR
jgi:hypothetical protein